MFTERNAREFSCRIDSAMIDRAEIYRCMGFVESIPTGELSETVDAMTAEAVGICHPRMGYRVVCGELLPANRLLLGDKLMNPGPVIHKSLEGSDGFALLVASVGEELDEWIKSCNEGKDILKAYLAHMLGAYLAELVVDLCRKHLEAEVATEECHVSNSYSPGYCGWNISEQALFFSLLPAGFCGVRLTESKLMLPVKSVSAVVGIGPDVEKRPYHCAICNRKDCYKRKITE